MLLEEALLATPLRTADEADRALSREGQHDRRDRSVIVGELTLGLTAFGEDHPLAAADLHLVLGLGCFLRLLRLYLARLLVAAQAEEATVAHVPVGGELGKSDLGDQFGFEPGHPACARLVGLDRGGLALQLLHLSGEVGERIGIEAGADIALVDEVLALMLGEQQAGKRAAFRGRFLPSDDDEFLPPGALDLDPALAPPPGVSAIDGLGNDPFLPGLAHRAVKLLARAYDVIGHEDRWRRIAEQRFEPLLALDVGECCQVLSRKFEQVEGVELQLVAGLLRSVPALEHVLERREIRIALGIGGNDLAVYERARQVQCGNDFNKRCELVRPVLAAAGVNANFACPSRRSARDNRRT